MFTVVENSIKLYWISAKKIVLYMCKPSIKIRLFQHWQNEKAIWTAYHFRGKIFASTSRNIILESFDFVNRRYSKVGWNNCEHSNVPVPLCLTIFMNELDYDYGKAEGKKQVQKDILTCRLILALSACLHSKSKSDKCKFADLFMFAAAAAFCPTIRARMVT